MISYHDIIVEVVRRIEVLPNSEALYRKLFWDIAYDPGTEESHQSREYRQEVTDQLHQIVGQVRREVEYATAQH